MVKYSDASLDATFGALAHPTRRAILKRLAQSETSVQDLARPLRLSLSAISKHITALEQGGMIVSEKRGRVRQCRLFATPLRDASAWLDFYRQFWETRMDGLGNYLKSSRGKK